MSLELMCTDPDRPAWMLIPIRIRQNDADPTLSGSTTPTETGPYSRMFTLENTQYWILSLAMSASSGSLK